MNISKREANIMPILSILDMETSQQFKRIL